MPRTATRPKRDGLKTPSPHVPVDAPRVVNGDWICREYGIAQRTLERLIEKGVLTPFRPGGVRANRFYSSEVAAALEGEVSR